jgi:hypothetical protein
MNGAAQASAGIERVLARLRWMRASGIWPNGRRYLWTDAFGLVLLVSLYRVTNDARYLDEARDLVAKVERILGRPRGLRIGEAADRDGQYFHYLAMWIFALGRLGRIEPEYRDRAVRVVREIHDAFVTPGVGVAWKMEEDLSAPYPGYGIGALDPFHGYVVYRLLDDPALEREIAEMRDLVQRSYRELVITQDPGLGMMLWISHFFPEEEWSRVQRARALEILDRMWIEFEGFFCREPRMRTVKFAFTNYGVAIGLRAVGAMPERVERLRRFFASYRSGDEYDMEAITHVMACSADHPGELLCVRPGELGSRHAAEKNGPANESPKWRTRHGPTHE